MTRRLRILPNLVGLVLLLALGSSTVARPAFADGPALGSETPGTPGTEPKTKEQLEAQQHFQRAKDLYQTGAYREAIAELEQARGLDPKAKDLVFNLGIVHEKLGKFDEAIAFFRQYMEMEGVTAVERGKAENIIKRIEGAKREVAVPPRASGDAHATTEPARGSGDGRGEQEPGNGRIDAATVAAGSVAVVGLGLGATFGILALSTKPSGFVTGRDGTYDMLQSKTSSAHTEAVVADIGFGVGIAAAVVTAYLYFGRSKDTKPRADGGRPPRASALPTIAPSISASPTGGALLLGGTFL
jgi:hypothetical protein